jgi:acyl-CoA thioester hydrolase
MTTRHYVAMFDDAAYHMLYSVFGWTGSSDDENRIAWADVQHTIDYKAEVSAGDILEIEAKLTKIGNKSITIYYEMKNLGNNEVAATLQVISVLFDLKTRESVVISEDLKDLASKHLDKA